jgi:hypothetical protein
VKKLPVRAVNDKELRKHRGKSEETNIRSVFVRRAQTRPNVDRPRSAIWLGFFAQRDPN